LRWRERAYEVPDRAPAWLRETAVDATHGLVDLAFQRPVLGDALAARHHHLGEHDPSPIAGVALEQALDGEYPLVDALGVIEPIHAQDLGDPRGAPARRPVHRGDLLGEPLDLGHVDADG